MKKILGIILIFFGAFAQAQNVTVVGPISTPGQTFYPTHYDSLQKGGYRIAADITERDAIPTLRRKLGMVVYTIADQIAWRLYDATLGNGDWRNETFTPGIDSVTIGQGQLYNWLNGDIFKSYPIPFGVDSSTRITNEGRIIRIDSMRFFSQYTTYNILGQPYSVAAQEFTLPDAHPTLDMIVKVVADVNGQLGLLVGTPGLPAQEPFVSPSTQIELASFMIRAAAITPEGISDVVVYKESALAPEWIGASGGGASPNFTSTTHPFSPPHSTRVNSYANNNYIIYTTSNPVQASTATALKFMIWLDAPMAANARIAIRLQNTLSSPTVATPYAYLTNGNYNFNSALVGVWQPIAIDFKAFYPNNATQPGDINRVWFIFNGTGTGVNFDNILIQLGGAGSGGGSTVTAPIPDSLAINTDSTFWRFYANGTEITKLRMSTLYDPAIGINGISIRDSLISGRKTKVIDGGGVSGGGGNPNTTLQKAFDSSVVAGDNPTIDASGNPLTISNLSSAFLQYQSDGYGGVIGMDAGSKEVGMGINHDTASVAIGARFDTDNEKLYVNIQSINLNQSTNHSIKIYDNEMFIGSTLAGQTSKITIPFADTLLTAPEFVWVTRETANGSELVKYPFSSFGGGGGSGGISSLGTGYGLTKPNDSTYNVDSSVIATRDRLANELGLKLNISDTASMLSPYKTSYPRQAISLTTTGTGAATYNSTSGVLNIPTPSAGSTIIAKTPVTIFTKMGADPYDSIGIINTTQYSVLGRSASGSGQPSFISGLDSNFVTGLHTQPYYDLRYLSSTSGWGTLGNAGTDSTTNFIGTTDAKPFNIRTNNVVRMHVNSLSGNIGIGATADPLYKLYVNGAINPGGASGVSYWIPNGNAFRGLGSGSTQIYIDGNGSLGGTINLRSTTLTITGAASAPSFTATTSGFNSTSPANGYSQSGNSMFNLQSDSSVLRVNDNTLVKRTGFRGTAWQMRDDNTSPIQYNWNQSAMLDLNSTTRGLLLPRLTTTQRNAIVSGGVVYGNTTTPGTGYTTANYFNLPLTGGTGSGITVKAVASGSVNVTAIQNAGTGYTVGDVLTASLPGGTGFQFTVSETSLSSGGMLLFNTDQRLLNNHNGTAFNQVAEWGIKQISSTYAILTTDRTIEATTGTFTATLPTAVGQGGKVYIIKNSGAGAVTVGTTSSQTIDGSTTYNLASQYKYVHVQSNGANWIVIANN